jgi:hypothetical protein
MEKGYYRVTLKTDKGERIIDDKRVNYVNACKYDKILELIKLTHFKSFWGGKQCKRKVIRIYKLDSFVSCEWIEDNDSV